MSFLTCFLQVNSEPHFPSPGEHGFNPIVLFVATMGFVLLVLLPIYSLYLGLWKNFPPYLQKKYRPYLKEIPLYNRLDPATKRRFERRVQRFISQKHFTPRSDGLVIDPRKKALIAGTAIELTLGFKRFDFAHFERILIYSNDYYSKISKRYHRGEVGINGVIVLSWAAFEEGNANRYDGINLGIHELAHALKLENKIVNRNYHFIDRTDYRLFHEEYKLFCETEKKQSFLRSYARTNIHEFFAVCCENFIERPEKFEMAMPSLYALMCRILRMDPRRF